MSYQFVHGKNLTGEIAEVLGFAEKPVRSISLRFSCSEAVSVVVEFVPQVAEAEAVKEILKHYQLHEIELQPSILESDDYRLDDLGHPRRTRPVMLEDGQYDGETARIIVGGKADRDRRAKTKEGQVYVATDRRHGGDFGLQIWACTGVEPKLQAIPVPKSWRDDPLL